jgi:hypothetical protein
VGGSKRGSPVVKDEDPWQPVTDASSGQTYWWNTQTNETTALGAPKPSAIPSPPPPANGNQPAVPPPQQQSGGIMSGLGGLQV